MKRTPTPRVLWWLVMLMSGIAAAIGFILADASGATLVAAGSRESGGVYGFAGQTDSPASNRIKAGNSVTNQFVGSLNSKALGARSKTENQEMQVSSPARRPSSLVTEPFLDELSWRESRNRDSARGQHGELGRFQIRECALTDVNKHFGWRVKHNEVSSARVGRMVARAYCLLLERQLKRALRRQPSQFEISEAYRFGFSGFMRRFK